MARVIALLAAALLMVLPAPALAADKGAADKGAAGSGDAWPDGVNPDSLRAATVGAASITAGRAHSCATTSAGTVYCWGSDTDGQLGDGPPLSNVTRAVPVTAPPGMRVVVQVDAGEKHTCALEHNGAVFCWGDNSLGQLGTSATGDQDTPAQADFPQGSVLVEVTTGENHSCAIDEQGDAWCWGAGNRGQLGNGASTDQDEPVRVTDATGLTDPVVDIAAGGDATCAATADGVAWCWGAGDRGQLGDGTGTDVVRPVRVSTNVTVRQIAVGKQQSCAVDEDGRAACWGRTASGVENAPVAAGGPVFRQVAVGGEHVCGVDRQEAGWCWGEGGEGQLGDGGTADRAAPGRIDRDPDIDLRDLDSGDEHSCALDERNVAFCWGNAGAGRLGAGASGASGVPVQVQGLPRAPAAVSGVRAVPIDRGLRISWRPATGFGSGDFLAYLAVSSGYEAFCTVGTATGTGCDLTGLANGRQYDVTVFTYATDGTELSEFATATPGVGRTPSTPTPSPAVPDKNTLAITTSASLVPPAVALGFLLIGLGLAALLVKKGE
ncbi:hypothetical protein [Actinoplanes sp. NBRC 103695]|uniref:RCC1 domain-containing protein n=1 Tax=Actinoplanes sp. NBRC 103695 TaxID=3032202 RepID=UPI0024A1BFAB|nr:hypothetical protein [Actinoplanes sp. NBRC 103695]GLY96204.1 hypothetical protein Acsp02_34590 [Actinoplanes sp. NBRC 103695]